MNLFKRWFGKPDESNASEIELVKVQAKANAIQAECDNLRRRFKGLEAELAQTKSKLNHCQSDRESLNRKLKDSEAELAQHQPRMDKLQSENSSLSSRVSTMEAELNALRENIKNVKRWILVTHGLKNLPQQEGMVDILRPKTEQSFFIER